MDSVEVNDGPTWSERAAMRFNACGQSLEEKGAFDRALQAYRRAAEMAPAWSVPWYNMGLYYKYAGDWATSRECNQRAVALDEENQPAWWNLGIAATALGDWPEARRAWTGFGIQLEPGEGPVSLPCGLTPIRVNPAEAPEVVWGDRIDPARALIRNVPLPECGRRFGDLVLHDGAANGYRKRGEVEVPVFDELAVLEPSGYLTLEVHVGGVSATALESLDRALHEADGGCCEVWSSTLQMLCRACSEGRPHDHEHDHDALDSQEQLRVGIASRSEATARAQVDAWLAATPEAVVLLLETVLAPSAHGAPVD